MLEVRTISSDYTLNSFEEIGEKSFIPGTYTKIAMRLYHTEKDLRFIPPVGAIVSVSLLKTANPYLQKVADIETSDRSIISVELSGAETEDLLGGNIVISVDLLGNGTKIEKGWAFSALRKIITT
jgi:hypothetical protein